MARHTPSIQCPPDDSPLLRAARLAASEELTTLLQSGHNVAAVDSQGWTCIHHLCSSSEPRKEKALQILLRHGADVEARSASLLTGLHIAAAQTGDLAFLSQLLLASRDTGAPDALGRTALHYVALGSTAADAGSPHLPPPQPQPSDAREPLLLDAEELPLAAAHAEEQVRVRLGGGRGRVSQTLTLTRTRTLTRSLTHESRRFRRHGWCCATRRWTRATW